MTDPELAPFEAAILRAFPALAGARFRILASGWHSTAVEVEERLIFKFPRSAEAERALRREAALLAVIRPGITLPVPDLSLHEGPPLFSRHEKLPGRPLLSEDYAALPEAARQRLGETLARFYAELHRLDPATLRAAGAEPLEPWQSPAAVRARALPLLPPGLRAFAEATLAAYEALPPDPFGETYGFFDGHGWNMAFDHARGRLNGIYDFADSGFGPLHQDFIYSNLISPDLTARVVAAYGARTGRRLEPRRIALLTGFHRLSELAALAEDPQHAPAMVGYLADWAAVAP